MKAMERASRPAYMALKNRDPKTWCKAFFETHSCTDNVENNMSESFNSWIINERYTFMIFKSRFIYYEYLSNLKFYNENLQVYAIA